MAVPKSRLQNKGRAVRGQGPAKLARRCTRWAVTTRVSLSPCSSCVCAGRVLLGLSPRFLAGGALLPRGVPSPGASPSPLQPHDSHLPGPATPPGPKPASPASFCCFQRALAQVHEEGDVFMVLTVPGRPGEPRTPCCLSQAVQITGGWL